MSNDAKQNPRNKVGRHSGAGPAGISEIVPTAAESRRGLEPVRAGSDGGWLSPLGLGLGAAALVGAGVAAYAAWRARQPRDLRSRIMDRVGLR